MKHYYDINNFVRISKLVEAGHDFYDAVHNVFGNLMQRRPIDWSGETSISEPEGEVTTLGAYHFASQFAPLLVEDSE